MPDEACQASGRAGTSRFGIPVRVYRFFYLFRNDGPWAALRKTVDFICRAVPGTSGNGTSGLAGAGQAARATLGLKPGDWVQVKSEAEILATLDGSGKNKGMVFMPQMKQYCGKTFRVYKRVENIIFEESHTRRRLKDTVLLEGLICEGDGYGCDRSCFFFWREDWLTRVDGPASPRVDAPESLGAGR